MKIGIALMQWFLLFWSAAPASAEFYHLVRVGRRKWYRERGFLDCWDFYLYTTFLLVINPISCYFVSTMLDSVK